MTPNDSGNGASNAMQRKGCNAVCNTVTNARETLAIPSPTPPALPPQPYPPQCRYSPVHHGVQLVTRDSAPVVAPSPVTTPDAMMSLAAIEHLDFEPEVPCDGAWDGELCQNAAFGVVVALCRGCREGGQSFICRRCWAGCQTAGWLCPSCDRSCEPRFIRLVVTFR